MKLPKKILLPTDFSEGSHDAATYSIELCKILNAKIYVSHVVDVGTLGVYTASSYLPTKPVIEEITATAEKSLKEFVKNIPAELVAESYVHSDLSPVAQTICRDAEKRGVDWIVMSTHGRTGLNRVMIGSVAEKVVRLAPS
jgi:nucleotide-binding universal stress UspA family protein